MNNVTGIAEAARIIGYSPTVVHTMLNNDEIARDVDDDGRIGIRLAELLAVLWWRAEAHGPECPLHLAPVPPRQAPACGCVLCRCGRFGNTDGPAGSCTRCHRIDPPRARDHRARARALAAANR